ncbi:FAD-dependent oxidoreductase [Chloropicon primus]|uniref:FAD-dependent oxidoreductase n=1 Tax=Chloropicon primus TaxID=1764295 RepID=A0A5B8N203_9CHLO|nr:FAD-dependent oxidoreductase [Chloropicon primus]UPR05096.1 FAD-dependent oxidoreductase [Chloropicon primus]|mmetsp:Transcript_3369/g.9408  ORF Transcript_3369/g.9408 Transcript_3369/m.9408 type:complete len:417 (+) Transcript_3369:531-1781(+)|eukprot:QDZ25895.1 FAD-dependent oxidoreductase [Chloropicon primus]
MRSTKAVVVMSKAGEGVPRQRHVVILGGGIQGTSAAYQLAKRGCGCTIVELEGIGSAASGKAGGFLARDWGDGPTSALHTESFRMHKELAEELGLETFREIDTLSVASGRGQKGLGMRSWLDGDIAQAKLLDSNTAQVTPLEITTKLAEAAQEKGCEVVLGRAKGIKFSEVGEDLKAEAVRVELADGKGEELIRCTDVLVAMGVWSTLVAPWFGLPDESWPITGIKSTHVIWRNSGGKREAVVREPAALFCSQEQNGTHLELYPRSNGDLYACGIGGSDYVEDRNRLAEGGDCGTPSSVRADMSRVAAATESAGKLSSLLKEAPEHVGACMRPCPPDALPFMGKIDGCCNAFLSSGHNCWGICWAPVCGLLMAELILDGQTSSIDLRPFSPSRFLPRAQRGKRGRKKVDLDVGEQW